MSFRGAKYPYLSSFLLFTAMAVAATAPAAAAAAPQSAVLLLSPVEAGAVFSATPDAGTAIFSTLAAGAAFSPAPEAGTAIFSTLAAGRQRDGSFVFYCFQIRSITVLLIPVIRDSCLIETPLLKTVKTALSLL